MIGSFKGKQIKAVAIGKSPKGFPPNLVRRSGAMLTALNAAVVLEDLRFPPGNHLEKLSGNRNGQHSVRINQQWRICFIWTDSGPINVEFVDYH
ncbi:MAG: type II toxin-antitoxin system RelE/ParE family toxin [Rhizobiaceae bacterium]